MGFEDALERSKNRTKMYVKAEADISAATEYDPSGEDSDITDADSVGVRLDNLTLEITGGNGTIEFWDYRASTPAYRNAEDLKADEVTVWEDEEIGKHRITPDSGTITIITHRGSGFA